MRKVLLATTRLLAQPVSQEISILCELRNHLLTGQTSFKFYSPDGMYGDRPHVLGSFFADYGQPEIALIVSFLSHTSPHTFTHFPHFTHTHFHALIGSQVRLFLAMGMGNNHWWSKIHWTFLKSVS